MSRKEKIWITLLLLAGILAVGALNLIRARHETAHNSAIDGLWLQQPDAHTSSNSLTVSNNSTSPAR